MTQGDGHHVVPVMVINSHSRFGKAPMLEVAGVSEDQNPASRGVDRNLRREVEQNTAPGKPALPCRCIQHSRPAAAFKAFLVDVNDPSHIQAFRHAESRAFAGIHAWWHWEAEKRKARPTSAGPLVMNTRPVMKGGILSPILVLRIQRPATQISDEVATRQEAISLAFADIEIEPSTSPFGRSRSQSPDVILWVLARALLGSQGRCRLQEAVLVFILPTRGLCAGQRRPGSSSPKPKVPNTGAHGWASGFRR
mmetsp:Transcript_38868/g.91307  ORF Transcript_38868/g.91307 Transcript_38868/m.91307 type:complete len:252 (+) Transcript_38868:1816-2571(+)